MKIKITYQTEEELKEPLSCLLSLYPTAKVRKSESHPPYRHAYLNIKGTKKPSNDADLFDITPPYVL